MKLFPYLTRKTGLGRTPWLRSILIHVLAIALVLYGIRMLALAELWGFAVLGIGLAVLAIFWGGTLSNYRDDKAAEERGPGSPHKDEVCEYCKPPRYEDGRPLEMVKWFMATRHVTEAQAKEALMMARLADQLGKLVLEHSKYLNHPKFDKFRNN